MKLATIPSLTELSLPHMLFFVSVALGALYFSFRDRRFDFFSVAFLSSMVYFMPGFIGFAISPPTQRVMLPTPLRLVPETYAVMIAVLCAVLVGAIVFDAFFADAAPRSVLPGASDAVVSVTVLAVVACALTVLTVGAELLNPRKAEMMAAMNRWYIFWSQATALGAILAFVQRRRLLLTICLLLLAGDLYIGYRKTLAMVTIAIFTVVLTRMGPQRVAIRSWKYGIPASLAAFFVFAYKKLYILIKAGDFSGVVGRVTDPIYYVFVFVDSEPFTIQANLNEVIRTNLVVGLSHFESVINQFVVFASAMGGEVVSFNDRFQPVLFPGVRGGMAHNIWAEMWSGGGWPLLCGFIVFYTIVLGFGSYLLRSSDVVMRGIVALLFTYWAFYIHRNDIQAQISFTKQVIGIALFSVAVSIAFTRLGALLRRRRQWQGGERAESAQ
ncbi:MAG TPA: hypothetical protein VMO26_01050 [Vicinamibacterales bacterium]|nr:hypothetical protein [Vicinamibacterales bacterium]